jgi:hypothetical protein
MTSTQTSPSPSNCPSLDSCIVLLGFAPNLSASLLCFLSLHLGESFFFFELVGGLGLMVSVSVLVLSKKLLKDEKSTKAQSPQKMEDASLVSSSYDFQITKIKFKI